VVNSKDGTVGRFHLVLSNTDLLTFGSQKLDK